MTHGAMVMARVAISAGGVRFRAGAGVGAGDFAGPAPLASGSPRSIPCPRAMMEEVVGELAAETGEAPDIEITLSIPHGADIAKKTWNPRLGIEGGLSILGTTGVVRPFSCAAWIASIHRGIDVARAAGLSHVAGCTGATSEGVVQGIHGLSDNAMLDMGDFVRRHGEIPAPEPRAAGHNRRRDRQDDETCAGGCRSSLEAVSGGFCDAGGVGGDPEIAGMNTALQAYESCWGFAGRGSGREGLGPAPARCLATARPRPWIIVVIDPGRDGPRAGG